MPVSAVVVMVILGMLALAFLLAVGRGWAEKSVGKGRLPRDFDFSFHKRREPK